MKVKTTRKAIVESTAKSNLVCAGYCDLSYLLHNHSAIAYTCGIYGWNFDVFEVYGKTVCTGYRNMPGRRANNIGDCESKARAIMEDYNKPYDMRSAAIESLLQEFCAQC